MNSIEKFIKHLWLLKYTNKIEHFYTKEEKEKIRKEILEKYNNCNLLTEFKKKYKNT